MRLGDDPVLGIETSCDETAAAVLDADGRVLAEALLSQTDHAAYGGIVPEIAARAHLAVLPTLVARVMREAGWNSGSLGVWRRPAGRG
jgi:N6-L-threonylcarbamoyladenine synthase